MDEIINDLMEYLDVKEKIIGIMMYGSILLNEQDKYSDIDILIVLENKYVNDCGRGAFFKGNIEIEFFIETEDNIYKELIQELDSLEPINRNRFLLGKIIRDKDDRLKEIKKRAQKMELMPYTPLSEKEKLYNGIFFKNNLKKLKRKNKNKELDEELFYYDYLGNLIKFYYRINCKPIIFDKMYRTLIDDDYRKKNLQSDIEDEFVKKTILELIKKVNIKRLEKLVNYILKDYLPKEKTYRIYYKN